MKIAVAILSDIHFGAPGNPILHRAEQIASAISTTDAELGTVLIILAGDLVNSGSRDEFVTGSTFLGQLKTRLSGRLPATRLLVAAVPGNHDCFLPSSGEDHRKSLVERSIPTVNSEQPDEYFVRDLLSVQNEYWNFAEQYTDFVPNQLNGRLCAQFQQEISGRLIQLNLLNSALLSQRHEDRANLRLPVEFYRRNLSLDADVTVSFSVLHHPPFWIEPTTMTALRQVLNRVSDVVITGHEHFTSSFSQSQSTGEELSFYESPALYEPERPTSSAFRVLVFDLGNSLQKELIFRWRDQLYRPSAGSESEWKPLLVNRAPRYAFEMTTEFKAQLSDLGIAYVHTDAPNVTLAELFVYPDIRLDENDPTKNSTTLKGDSVTAFFNTSGVVILRGGAFSGKTALCKSVCSDGYGLSGKVAVLLDGTKLDDIDPEGFQKLVTRELKRQYKDADVDAYLQLSKEQRLIVIDNWHLARLSTAQRDRIYGYLNSFTSSSLLVVDELFQLRQLIVEGELAGISSTELPYKQGEILGLSYVSRGRLINKWYGFRKAGHTRAPEESNTVKLSEDRISSLLGKDNLPPYAFFVLCMLQAQESQRIESISGGSFGHYHEVLVVTALTRGRPRVTQLDRKVAFCCEVAYHMWKKNVDLISRQEIDSVAEAYRQRHLMSLHVENILADLCETRVLSEAEGNYRFSYTQFQYYFVARYIKEHFEDEQEDELRAAVDEMIDNISSHRNSTILMFLIFFANDRRYIIDRLVSNAARIYDSVTPARLQDDAKPFIERRDWLPPPTIGENADVAANRAEQRRRRDEATEREGRSPAVPDEVYRYDDSLPDEKKMRLAERNMDALGQVIRNFSTNLPGDLKISVLTATYSVGLRTMARVLGQVVRFIEERSEALQAKEHPWELADDTLSITFIREHMDRIALVLGKLVSIHYCRKISSCVGVSDNELAYERAMEAMEPSVAIKLIDATIQMEHSRTFPEAKITALWHELKSNPFAIGILQFLIGLHLLVYNVEDATRSRITKLTGLDVKRGDAAALKLSKPDA